MSSRAMRKLLREDGPAPLVVAKPPVQSSSEEVEEEEEEEEEDATPSTSASLFAQMAALKLQHGGEEEANSSSDEEPATTTDAEVTHKPSSSHKHKKKQKKAKAQVRAEQRQAELDRQEEADLKLGQDLAAFSSWGGSSSSQAPYPDNSRTSSVEKKSSHFIRLLKIEPTMLKADDELARMFGGHSVLAAALDPAETEVSGHSSRPVQERPTLTETIRAQRGGRGVRALPRHTDNSRSQRRRRAGVLISKPNPAWPPPGGVNALVKLSTIRPGVYRLQPVPAHDTALQHFLSVQRTHNPQAIAELLREYPYMPEAILQLVEVAQVTGQPAEAEGLLIMLLYSMESYLPGGGGGEDLLTGGVRLPAGEGLNSLYLDAIARYVSILDRKGCPRAALEWAKLLVALDPHDPTGVGLRWDLYALRAREWAWLVEMRQEAGEAAGSLPNMMFSEALARFQLEYEGGVCDLPEAAVQGLVEALAMFPPALPLLADRCGVRLRDPGANASVGMPETAAMTWGDLSQSTTFTRGGETSDPLYRLLTLYADRSASVWNFPEVLALLKAAACRLEFGGGNEEVKTLLKKGLKWRRTLFDPLEPGNLFESFQMNADRGFEPPTVIPQELLEGDMGGGGGAAPLHGFLGETQEQAVDADAGLLWALLQSVMPSVTSVTPAAGGGGGGGGENDGPPPASSE